MLSFKTLSIAPENVAAALATLADSGVDAITVAALAPDTTPESFLETLCRGYYDETESRAAYFTFLHDTIPVAIGYTRKHVAEHIGIMQNDDESRLVYVQHIGCDTIAVTTMLL